ncbi:MAG TPA: hypothetical protein VNT04_01210 [Gaiellaceae bacterium]|jgi:hypothetical protein|nr:hypothetical protein [Gaiellaceae bacterium]
MRFYPDIPSRRAKRFVADVAVFLLLVLFLLLGLRVHDAVDNLVVVSQGVQETGSAVQSGFQDAADALDDVPLVGGDLADSLRGAGEGSGGRVEDLGQQGVDRTHRLANLLGLLTFLLPSVAVLSRYLPGRVEHVRRLTSAARVLDDHGEPERRRLVAMRAAFALPYDVLLRHTSDPFGDLAGERYDPLIAAALEDVGLRAPV